MLGYYFVYEIESHYEKQDLYDKVNLTLPSETIVTFQIPLTNYPQPNREVEPTQTDFAYGGKFYDLSRQWIQNDTLFIEAFENPKQKMLEQSLYEHVQDHLLDQRSNTTHEKSKRILANFIKDYLPDSRLELTPKKIMIGVSSKVIYPTTPQLSTRSLEISSPPPQHMS